MDLQIKVAISSRYTIDEDGIVRNKKTGKVNRPCKNKNGYYKHILYLRGSLGGHIKVAIYLHRLVAMFHLEDWNESLQVNHKDGDKSNNKKDNIEMVTASQNILHGWRLGSRQTRLDKLDARRLPNGRFGNKK